MDTCFAMIFILPSAITGDGMAAVLISYLLANGRIRVVAGALPPTQNNSSNDYDCLPLLSNP